MRQKLILLCFTALCSLTTAFAVPITSKRIVPEGMGLPRGTLFITTAGRERAIAKQVWKAWIIEAGRAVVYAGSDGAGGFENEGQSLWRYDAQSGQRRKLMSEYFMIDNVREARSRSGQLALVVSMSDGGLGAPHVAVVHPQRGEVWRRTVTRLSGTRNGRIAVGVLRTDEITDSPEEYRVRRMLYLDLDKLLARPIIRLKTYK
jgi:hypothetical protein